MIKLDQAVSQAKDFLTRSGVSFTSLEEISLKDKKWIVVLSNLLYVFTPSPRYIVELDAETGDIIGFRKELGTNLAYG